MTVSVSASPRALSAAIKENAEHERDLLLELLLAQKISILHLGEVSGEVFEEDDVEMETS